MNLWLMGISAFCLIVLIVLFRYEARSGRRLVLSRLREWADVVISRIYFRLTHLSIHIGTGSIRLMVHFIAHRLLSMAMWSLKLIENSVSRLQRRNRQVAMVLRDEQTKTHLHLIAEHKESNALSEEEKTRLKNDAIEP